MVFIVDTDANTTILVEILKTTNHGDYQKGKERGIYKKKDMSGEYKIDVDEKTNPHHRTLNNDQGNKEKKKCFSMGIILVK